MDKSGNEAERDNMFTVIFFCDHLTQLSRVSGICENLRPLYCWDRTVIDSTVFGTIFVI